MNNNGRRKVPGHSGLSAYEPGGLDSRAEELQQTRSRVASRQGSSPRHNIDCQADTDSRVQLRAPFWKVTITPEYRIWKEACFSKLCSVLLIRQALHTKAIDSN